jgi:molecular chaperone DnaJ
MSTRDFIEKDYYAALGVAKDADKATIRKAYRKLARTYHPDANAGDAKAEEKFKEISEAYDVLSDDTRRREYDEARALFANGGFSGFGGAPGGGVHFDFGDLFGGGGAGGAGGLGDLLGGIFGGRAGGRGARRGADVESEIAISFTDAVQGVTVPLRLSTPHVCGTCHGSGAKPGTSPRTCPTCGGSGQVARSQGGFAFAEPCRECRGRGVFIDDPCPTCHGSGRAMSDRTLTVRIPAGVADGQRIRLAGRGQPGDGGAPAGDLFVVVHVQPHPVFGRSGEDLTLTLPISYTEAALGATVAVPTLDGPTVSVKIAPGTTSGRTLRIRGKGVPKKGGKTGDLLATVEIAVPQRLDGPAREALEKFRDALAETDAANPRRELYARTAYATHAEERKS